ncbi:terpenoid synthase [Aspergillus parasiticus]|uniref:Terpene synthase n=1 Tax=Aspergillus parasiticus TaxID=5067 RepID=A0A5N6D7D3_ASPPA|nr:terpenoid synthase [Aspergillus parasiticus]
MLEPIVPHQAFRKSLRGERATIPNLYDLFPDWTPRFHPDLEKARVEVLNPWLERWVDEPQTRAKLQAANFAIFAAIVCADASFEKLCTVAKYFAWYFVWDDQFDCGSLTNDEYGRANYQQKSKEYFEHALLQKGSRPDLSSFTKGQQMALLCWDEVGEHISACCSKDAREIILRTMLPFVESVDTVDSIYVHDCVPTVAQYWQRRDLTAAVYPVIATLLFIHAASTPVTSLQNPDLANLWKHTSYIVHITNDMLSMPKEANDGQIEGLVPVLMMNYGINCATAMEWSFQLAQVQVRGIRAIEARLRENTEQCEELSKLLTDVFIDGCKDVAMGLIHWSYHGERYFQNKEIRADYTIEFEL